MDETIKKSLIDAHKSCGGVAFLELPEGTLAFKAPRFEDYERFQDKMAREKGESAAMRELMLCSMVHPKDLTAGTELLRRYPAAIPQIVRVLQRMAGSEVEIDLKAG